MKQTEGPTPLCLFKTVVPPDTLVKVNFIYILGCWFWGILDRLVLTFILTTLSPMRKKTFEKGWDCNPVLLLLPLDHGSTLCQHNKPVLPINIFIRDIKRYFRQTNTEVQRNRNMVNISKFDNNLQETCWSGFRSNRIRRKVATPPVEQKPL